MFEWYEWIFITICFVMFLAFLEGRTSRYWDYKEKIEELKGGRYDRPSK